MVLQGRDAPRLPLPTDEGEEFTPAAADDDVGEAESWGAVEDDDLPTDAAAVVLQEVAEQSSYGELLLADLIRRQRRLALSVTGVFLVLLLGLPLVNLLLPTVAALPVFGLPLTWVLLAILIYPLLWLLGWYFSTTARALEDEFVAYAR